jgi:RNA polymerase sigma factor (sigma-70 family)
MVSHASGSSAIRADLILSLCRPRKNIFQPGNFCLSGCIIIPDMPLLDKTFVSKCVKGNRAAQKQLFESTYAPMFRVCMRYLNHKEDAEDCLMKGFQKLFQNLEKFRFEGEASLTGWIRKIMVNECLMFLRGKDHFLLFPEEEPLHVHLPAEALARLDAVALNKLILDLPVGYRTVFNLFAVEGYAHKEIAAMLQISENTSKTQFSKARLRLRTLLEQQNSFTYGKLGEQDHF